MLLSTTQSAIINVNWQSFRSATPADLQREVIPMMTNLCSLGIVRKIEDYKDKEGTMVPGIIPVDPAPGSLVYYFAVFGVVKPRAPSPIVYAIVTDGAKNWHYIKKHQFGNGPWWLGGFPNFLDDDDGYYSTRKKQSSNEPTPILEWVKPQIEAFKEKL